MDYIRFGAFFENFIIQFFAVSCFLVTLLLTSLLRYTV